MDETDERGQAHSLELRLRALEDEACQGAGLAGFDWLVLVASCILLPLALLAWGWPQ